VRKGQGRWEDRKTKQLLPIHITAYLFLPENRKADVPGPLLKKAEEWIITRLGTTAYLH